MYPCTIHDLVLKEEGENEARVALLSALRRAERVLVNRDDDVDHRLPTEIVIEKDLAVSCNEETNTRVILIAVRVGITTMCRCRIGFEKVF